MVLVTIQTFVLFFISSCSPPNVTNPVTGEVDGAKIYKSYCKSCHGPKGDRGLSNAADLSISTLKVEEIRQIILYGTGNGMSAYKTVITEEEEIGALVNHVKSLQK
jgi:mono/diheme cytochrome c family protein